jgi:hypothetical protein
MGIYDGISDDELQEFVDNFLKEWVREDGLILGGDSSCPSKCEGKTCPKCNGKMCEKTSISFNGDQFKVWKCCSPKCGYCE